jgi:hypothetical protein
MTTTTQFIAGHNVHASITPGLTVCGKRTETLEQTDRFVSCQYCRSHMPTNRDALLALVQAIKSDPLQGPGLGDVSGQVAWDVRDAWLHPNE